MAAKAKQNINKNKSNKQRGTLCLTIECIAFWSCVGTKQIPFCGVWLVMYKGHLF